MDAHSDIPQRDGFSLVEDIDGLQQRLASLDHEQQAALVELRDAKYTWLVAETKLKSIRGELDVVKARSMSLMAMLRSLPK